jgi:predicted lysophospholipase L1 biosynthesis ABC-type transport system permease subunit
MLVVGERMQLVEVKAVDGDYPLRGRLAVGRDPFAVPVPTDVVPEPGTAWPDAQLAQVLKLAPGQGITPRPETLALRSGEALPERHPAGSGGPHGRDPGDHRSRGQSSSCSASPSCPASSPLLARRLFDIAFTFNPALLAYGIVGGGLGVTAFGLIATRPVLNSAPLETLRRV